MDLTQLLDMMATRRVLRVEMVVSEGPVKIELHPSAFSPAMPIMDSAPADGEPLPRNQSSPIPHDEGGICACGHTWLSHDGITCLGGGACPELVCSESWKVAAKNESGEVE